MVRNGIPRVFFFFIARKGIPSCVLFRGMVRNGILRICIYFGSTERNSELCFLLEKGSEQNYGSFPLFLFHRTEFRVVFFSAEGFGTELWEFPSIFVPRNGIPGCFLFRGRVRNGIPRFSVPRNNRNSVGNNHLFRLFRLPRNKFVAGNSQPYSKHDKHMRNAFHCWLSIGGTHFMAGWAYEEMISSLAEHKRKCLKVKYLDRIEYDFLKSRVTGPWDHKVSVSAKKSQNIYFMLVYIYWPTTLSTVTLFTNTNTEFQGANLLNTFSSKYQVKSLPH